MHLDAFEAAMFAIIALASFGIVALLGKPGLILAGMIWAALFAAGIFPPPHGQTRAAEIPDEIDDASAAPDKPRAETEAPKHPAQSAEEDGGIAPRAGPSRAQINYRKRLEACDAGMPSCKLTPERPTEAAVAEARAYNGKQIGLCKEFFRDDSPSRLLAKREMQRSECWALRRRLGISESGWSDGPDYSRELTQ